jgi:hypothetical protein
MPNLEGGSCEVDWLGKIVPSLTLSTVLLLNTLRRETITFDFRCLLWSLTRSYTHIFCILNRLFVQLKFNSSVCVCARAKACSQIFPPVQTLHAWLMCRYRQIQCLWGNNIWTVGLLKFSLQIGRWHAAIHKWSDRIAYMLAVAAVSEESSFPQTLSQLPWILAPCQRPSHCRGARTIADKGQSHSRMHQMMPFSVVLQKNLIDDGFT